jgi:hypothetical protein
MRLFGAGKISEKSFIAENMIVSVKVMNELLDEIEANENLCGKSFWEKIIDAVEPSQLPGSGFSEYETYGTFVMKNYPKMYGFADFHSYRNGKSLFGENPQKEQLEWISKKYVAVALERYHKKIPLIPLVLKTKFGRRLISVDSAEKFVWLWERFRGFRSRCMNFPKRIVRKVLKKS